MPDVSALIDHLFVPGASILEKILRPILIYAFLVIGIRLAGKRTLASLNAFDLVVIMSISNTVQNAIIGEDTSVSGGMIGAATLLIVNYLVVRFFFRHRRLDRFIEGKATVLIKDGAVIKRHCDRELISEHELTVAARKQGFNALSDIESCELEPGGALAFVAKTPTTEEVRERQLHAKLDALVAQLTALGAQLRKPQA
jgi:uncharacterized membrane protein YcaP (DUF421 family)